MALTPKQDRFVDEYLVDLNATQAAIRAGYNAKWAGTNADKLLKNTKLAAAIEAAKADRAQRVGVTADQVLSELSMIAFGDSRRVMTWGPNGVTLIDSATLADADAKTVAEVSQTVSKDGGSIKLKMHDKLKALDMLGRHLGLWKDGANTVNGDVAVTLILGGKPVTPDELGW